MTWNYAYTANIWPSLCTVLLLIALAVYSGRRRSVPGTLPFMIACLSAAAWASGSVMEYAAVGLDTKILWIKFQAAWQLPVTTAVTCFVLEYTWPGRWLTRRNLALLSVPPVLILLVILTDDRYHLAWRGFTVAESIQPQFSPVGWIAFAYAFGVLGALNLVVFGWLFLHSPQHRLPVVFMLAGQFGGRILYMLERTGLLHSALPVDLLGMAFEFLVYAFALFGFRIFDPITLARQVAIEQIQYGMLVLDSQGRILSLNPAAGAILGSPVRRLLGRPIQDLLPGWVDAHQDVQSAVPGTVELSLGAGPDIRDYQVDVSTLKDWRGVAVGRLLTLRDVTEQKKAELQILEQQRALATLQERERLARELHDGAGQVLAYVSMQAQAIANWVQDGELHKAETQLSRLASVAQDAHNDLRSSILSLRSGDPAAWSFLAALQQYLAAYQENYGICARLVLSPNQNEDYFPLDVGVQLVRVIQEALTNARKHAQARNVQVFISRKGDLVCIDVTDDGIGFDPNALPSDGQSHYGLAFMRERVDQLGGVLRVESGPGQGTRVIVEVPVNIDRQTVSGL